MIITILSICLFLNRHICLLRGPAFAQMAMNQDLLSLLELSYRTSSNEEIRAVTEALDARSKAPDYVRDLLLIIGDLGISEKTTCAALAQLKNYVRNQWGSSFYRREETCITPDKQILLDSLLTLNISLADNYQYGKIIKDIIMFLGESVLEHVPQLIEFMREGKEISTCLNFLLGIIGHYQYTVEEPQPHFYIFIETIIPILNQLIVQAQTQLSGLEEIAHSTSTPQNVAHHQAYSLKFDEILYLSIKFIKKCLNWMINRPQLRQHSFSWAVISLNKINIYKQDLLKKAEDDDTLNYPRGTEAFNYFHGRKWAIKFIIAFFQKILIYKQADPQVSQSTTQFYEAYWANITQVLYNMFNHRAPRRIKLIEFQLLYVVFKAKPTLMCEWFNFYMFQVLPSFITFVEEDIKLAVEDPLQFERYENEMRGEQDGNIRKKAADLWVKLILDTEYYIQKNVMLEQFKTSLQFIAECLKSNEGSQKIVGGYLLEKLCEKGRHNKIYKEFGKQIRQLSNWTISDFLNEGNFLYPTKALEIANNMASELREQNNETSNLLGEFVLAMFLNNQAKNLKGYELLRIKACVAMASLHPEWFKKLTDESLKVMLDSLLQMTVAYELEGIMSALRKFIYMVGYRIKEYAVATIMRLGQKLRFIKEAHVPQATLGRERYYNLQKYSAISGYISTLALLTFLLRERSLEINQALEDQLVFLLETYYSCNPFEENDVVDYVEDILDFFHQFLSQLKTIKLQLSARLWFFYSVIILKMIGLPKKYTDYLPNMSLSEVELRIMLNCLQREEYYLHQYLKILKVYQCFLPMDQHINTIQHIFHNLFTSSPLEQLFLMALYFYQNKKQNESQWDDISKNARGRLLSTILLIYVLEEHGPRLPKQALRYIWMIILKNERQTPMRKYIKRYNVQLFLVWIWVLGEEYLTVMSESNQEVPRMKSFMLKLCQEIPDYLTTYDLIYEEVRRTTLGLSTLLLIATKFPPLRNTSPDLLESLLEVLKKSLKLQGYEIEDSEQSYYSDQDELATEIWLRANNFTDEFQSKAQSKDEPQNQLIYEPNYVVELPRNENLHRTKEQELELDLEELAHPDSVYYEEYVSRIDSIQEYQYALQKLLIFKQRCPQEYLYLRQNLAQYTLASILRAIDADQKTFREYDIENLFNIFWLGDEEN